MADNMPNNSTGKTTSSSDSNAKDFYEKLGKECNSNRVVIDIIISPPPPPSVSGNSDPEKRQYVDIATLGEVCRQTSGRLCWLGRIHNASVMVLEDLREQLQAELRRSALSVIGVDAVFKLRCSAGVRVKQFLPKDPQGYVMDGEGILENSLELELGAVTPDTCIAVEVEHKVGGIPASTDAVGRRREHDPFVYFQSALLFTSPLDGRRRVRVSTLAIPATSNASEVFSSEALDFGSLVCAMTRKVVDIATRGSSLDINNGGSSGQNERDSNDWICAAREELTEHCVEIIACSSSRVPSTSRLAIPSSLQMLPFFCLGLRKSPMLCSPPNTGSPTKAFQPTMDDKSFYLFWGRLVSPITAMLLAHPTLYDITPMTIVPSETTGEWCTPSSSSSTIQQSGYHPTAISSHENPLGAAAHRSFVELPLPDASSMSYIADDGVYLLDDGFAIFLRIGPGVSARVRDELLESSTKDGLISVSVSKSSDLGSRKIQNLVTQLRAFNAMTGAAAMTVRPSFAPLVAVTSSPKLEAQFQSLLLDDGSNNANHRGNYFEIFMQHFQTMIQRRIAGKDKTR